MRKIVWLLSLALVGACSQGADVAIERGSDLTAAQVDGQHTMLFRPDQNKGITIETGPSGAAANLKYDVEIASRNGQISGCTVAKDGVIDDTARCALEDGNLLIRLGTDANGLLYALRREGAAISGDAYFRSSALPDGRLAVGTVRLSRKS